MEFEYTQTRAYVINKGSMNLYDQVYISWREIRVKELVNITFAYLSAFTYSIYGWHFEVATSVAWLRVVADDSSGLRKAHHTDSG